MKAIILSAGKGERLKSTGMNIPKPLLTVKGEVILAHNLKWLKYNGITEVYINLYHRAGLIKKFIAEERGFGVSIRYSVEPGLLGTAGGVLRIAEKWKEPFLVVYGDNYYPEKYDLKSLVRAHLRVLPLATLGFYVNKSELIKSGVATLDRNYRVKNFIEKPTHKALKKISLNRVLINAGVYVLSPEIMDYIGKGFSDFAKDVFPLLLKKKLFLQGYIFKGKLTAIDTMELYRKHCR